MSSEGHLCGSVRCAGEGVLIGCFYLFLFLQAGREGKRKGTDSGEKGGE